MLRLDSFSSHRTTNSSDSWPGYTILDLNNVDHPLRFIDDDSEMEQESIDSVPINGDNMNVVEEDIEQTIAVPLTSETDSTHKPFCIENIIRYLYGCCTTKRNATGASVLQEQILRLPPEPPLKFDKSYEHPEYSRKIRPCKINVVFLVLELVCILFDWSTDILTGLSYFKEGHSLEGSLTLGIVLFAGIISTCYNVVHKQPESWKELTSPIIRYLMYIPSLQPIVIVCESIRFEAFPSAFILKDKHQRVLRGLSPSSWSNKRLNIRFKDTFRQSLTDDALSFKTIEIVLEAGPQAFLQLFLFMLRIEEVDFMSDSGKLAVGTILSSLFSIAMCARSNFMSEYSGEYKGPPLGVRILLELFAQFNFFFRIVVCIVSFACVLQALLWICPWYLGGVLAFLVIFIPRLVYVGYHVFKAVQCAREGRAAGIGFSFSHVLYPCTVNWSCGDCKVEISLYYIIEQTVVTLVSSGPRAKRWSKYCTPRRSTLVLRGFLIIEPVVYLSLWGLVHYFFKPGANLLFILVLIGSLLLLYMSHFLIEKIFLKGIVSAATSWKTCNYIIEQCEEVLRTFSEVNAELQNGLRKNHTLFNLQVFLNRITGTPDDMSDISYSSNTPKIITDLTRTARITTLINFYNSSYCKFSEAQLQVDLLEKGKYIQTLLEFTMTKLTYALLKIKWTENNAVIYNYIVVANVVLVYLHHTSENPGKKVMKKLGTYLRYFSDPKQSFKCHGLIYEFNHQSQFPKIIEETQNPELKV